MITIYNEEQKKEEVQGWARHLKGHIGLALSEDECLSFVNSVITSTENALMDLN